MSGGINFDTTSLGGGGSYGGYGYGGGYGTNILDLAALGLVFGDGFGRHNYDGYSKGGCCPPATCEQMNDVDRDVIRCSNDVDRDVLKSAFDTTEAVHDEGRRIEKDVWDVDRDVLLSEKCIEGKICDSTHKLEKDIWDVDKDVLMGFKDSDHKIDMIKAAMKEGFAEVKGEIKATALCSELREKDAENRALARKLDDAKELVLKKDIVSEILAALCVSPVIANK